MALPLPDDAKGTRPRIDFVALLVDVRSRARSSREPFRRLLTAPQLGGRQEEHHRA